MQGRRRPHNVTLEEFEARFQPAGLFQSYCRARVRHWPLRQVLAGAVFLVLHSVGERQAALWAGLAILLSDTIEAALLRRYTARPPRPDRLPLAQGLSVMTAAVHALCVAAAVGALLSIGPHMRFLASAICIGMIVDAGQLVRLNGPAATARILPIAIMLAGIYLLALGNRSDVEAFQGVVADSAAIGLMLLFGLSFLIHSHGQRQRSIVMQRATLQQAQALAHLNASLSQTRKRSRKLACIVERMTDAVALTDENARITWTNAAFSQITQYSAGAAEGQPLTLLNGPQTDRQTFEQVNAAIRARQPIRVDVQVHRRDGSTVWMDAVLSPVREIEPDTLGFILLMRDIGEHKQREADLALARQKAEEAVKAKSSFLATMSHEIRTPMNGVIATCELLQDTSLDAEQSGLVETISSSGEALLTIINDILDYTKLEAGKLEVSEKPFDLIKAVEKAVALMAPLAEAKALPMAVTLPAKLPPPLMGDVARIRQVLLNLLGNAIKFTQHGLVRLRLRVQQEDGIYRVEIAVIDTGVGIAPERQAEIFDQFTQADASISRRFGGTGLGLAISQRIARAMGGDIRLKSRLGEGATFTFSLPLKAAPDNSLPAPAHAAETTGARAVMPDWGAHGILIAEDNRTNRMLIGKILAPTGATLRFAENGAEAVRLHADMAPDAILMDMSMPVMDGLEATHAIRAAETRSGAPRVPIVALTANAFAEDRQRCIAAGMDEHLTKPIRKAELLATLSGLLAARATADAAAPDAPDAIPAVAPPDDRQPRRVGRS